MARPPFSIPCLANALSNEVAKSFASFFVSFISYIFDNSIIIWRFTEVVVRKSTAGSGLTSITPPVIHIYLLITLFDIKYLCSCTKFLLLIPNLFERKRILSANNSSPLLSSVSIISLNKLPTSGTKFKASEFI